MKRRNFIMAALGGVVALPLVGKTVVQREHHEPGTWVLTHRESRSGLRCYDARIVLDNSEGERILMEQIKRNPAHFRKIVNG